MMGWYGTGMGGFGLIGMGLFWLALIGLIVWLVVRLLPGRTQQPPIPRPPVVPPTGAGPRDDVAAGPALEILDQRLARGEVDVETYQSIKATILDSRGGAR
ncbi:MAG: hypothetical protein KQH57_11275 [Actinomycetales bacterium]|nr:hypothetical protein [Actinomycetales bacterium]